MKKIKIGLFVLVSLTVGLFGKDYPLLQNQEIIIPNKELTVIEFPFEINGEIRYGIFNTIESHSKQEEEKNEEIKPVVLEEKTTQNKRILSRGKQGESTNSVSSKKTNTPVPTFKKGINTLEIMPKVTGDFDMTIWGYQKFPIVIRVKIKDKEEGKVINRFISFKDYSAMKAEPLKNSAHEDAIASMIKPMYVEAHTEKEICIDGHQLSLPVWEFRTQNGLFVKAIYECSGQRYAASKWVITNENARPLSTSYSEDYEYLHKNLVKFFRSNGRAVYAMNYASGNKVLRQNQSAYLYLVMSADKSKVYKKILSIDENGLKKEDKEIKEISSNFSIIKLTEAQKIEEEEEKAKKEEEKKLKENSFAPAQLETIYSPYYNIPTEASLK
ncbi:MAG: hypothetical protein KKE17_15790 [Proteobacteria bacterium]|nr:hypothetical protein [Pseudomonadota bacterium]MBU1901889.1 hypothetical protein [Patescibacteria group bacterium]